MLAVVAADPGRDTAPVRTPPWCGELKVTVDDINALIVGYEIDNVANGIKSAAAAVDTWEGDSWYAAEQTCRWPAQPSVQVGAQNILQDWINLTGMSADDALLTLKTLLHRDVIKVGRAKLCDALKLAPGASPEDTQTMTARRLVFGCTNNGAPRMPMWANADHVNRDLLATLQASSAPDDLAVLAWTLDLSRAGNYAKIDPHAMCAADAADFARLKPDNIKKLLDTAPYQANAFARVTILASIGRAQRGIAGMAAAVDAKKASSPGWTCPPPFGSKTPKRHH